MQRCASCSCPCSPRFLSQFNSTIRPTKCGNLGANGCQLRAEVSSTYHDVWQQQTRLRTRRGVLCGIPSTVVHDLDGQTDFRHIRLSRLLTAQRACASNLAPEILHIAAPPIPCSAPVRDDMRALCMMMLDAISTSMTLSDEISHHALKYPFKLSPALTRWQRKSQSEAETLLLLEPRLGFGLPKCAEARWTYSLLM